MNQLNAYLALEIMHDSMERAERERRAQPRAEQPPAPTRSRCPSGHGRARQPPRCGGLWPCCVAPRATLRH